ncbi:HotDog domain-containing protein [Mycena polygramma]|nr:HotDog domain-containing protein [Mycena polygramma]
MRYAENIDAGTTKSLSDLSHVLGKQPNLEKNGFGGSIMEQVLVTHAFVQDKAEEPQKKEARVVCEIDVTEDMLNDGGNIHGACSAFLIDMCSSACLMVFQRGMHVSQTLNIVYHSPAVLGEKLRIINTTMTVGTRVMTVRTEIWNATQYRLVASGVHVKMRPSVPKL